MRAPHGAGAGAAYGDAQGGPYPADVHHEPRIVRFEEAADAILAAARTRGVEASLNYRWRGLRAETAYLFADSRFRAPTLARIPQVPRHQGNLILTWLSAGNKTLLSGGIRSFGMQFEDQPAIGQACVANDADLPSEFAAKCNRGANQQGLQDLAVQWNHRDRDRPVSLPQMNAADLTKHLEDSLDLIPLQRRRVQADISRRFQRFSVHPENCKARRNSLSGLAGIFNGLPRAVYCPLVPGFIQIAGCGEQNRKDVVERMYCA